MLFVLLKLKCVISLRRIKRYLRRCKGSLFIGRISYLSFCFKILRILSLVDFFSLWFFSFGLRC